MHRLPLPGPEDWPDLRRAELDRALGAIEGHLRLLIVLLILSVLISVSLFALALSLAVR